VTKAPVCVSARVWSCDSLGSDLDCSSLGAPEGNPTNMRCRDPLTGATLGAIDPAGICLDDTVGGPFPEAPDAGADVGVDGVDASPDASQPDSSAVDANSDGIDDAAADA
jgi:hypothetical protein